MSAETTTMKAVEKALNATGLPWKITTGKKHRQVRLDGKLVGVLPFTSKREDPHAIKNVCAQIRRAAKNNFCIE